MRLRYLEKIKKEINILIVYIYIVVLLINNIHDFEFILGSHYAYFESSPEIPDGFPGFPGDFYDTSTPNTHRFESLKLENLPIFTGQRCLKFYYYAHHTDSTTNYGDLTVYEIPHSSTDSTGQKNILFIDSNL